jgi:hypothetical protein
VWGYRHDAADNLLGLWVTDSDDGSRERWLLPVAQQVGQGTSLKWRVGGNMPMPVKAMPYAGWLIEGVEALKPKAEITTSPDIEPPAIITVTKKCVDRENNEISCPIDDQTTVYVGDQVCDEECKKLVLDMPPDQAIIMKIVIDEDAQDSVTFEGWEVNGEMWPPDALPILQTETPEDVSLRPVVGCEHM